ncbi:hypothetical protein [Aequorivita marina]|uniref:hypothetical protein n=1 Tax=Aequorivita marina TaxID=3073654 RepID=UPI002874E539|nr:hypothetical protein [Aequorivita sp. S2608]MDS1296834.1 hypothetical protein [Aequorivita sp. S2608]
MPLRNLVLLLFILAITISYSQSTRFDTFGKPTQAEYKLNNYKPKPDAAGVILYESGNYYVASIVKKATIRLVREVHRKIKVLNAKKFDFATVEIPYKGGRFSPEEILDYKAVTHNGALQNFVPEEAFFEIEQPGNGKALKFTFPNIQDGSILEYRYTIVSSYFYDIEGWEFQHKLPTVYSLFQTVLPANFKYNHILYGNKKLSIRNSSIKPKAFVLPSNTGHVDSETNIFAMQNIPSFTEEEYMLSRQNYISRIVYEPLEIETFHGYEQVYTRSWDDVDDRFKNRRDFGEQLKKKSYFRRKLPNSILDIEDELERAKAVYRFIQNNYIWNGRYFNYGIKVKDVFDEKLGSVTAINLSLVNALKAAKLDAKSVILSTRNNGLPTEHYPVLSNFNYVLAVLLIDNEEILLDATDKQAPFAIIPFRALNVQARVLDFKKGSYWMDIKPFEQNIQYMNAKIAAEAQGQFSGKVNQMNSGYIALNKRNIIEEKTLQQYKKAHEKTKAGIEINDYQLEDLNTIEKPLKESYNITITPEVVGDKVILYPFFNKTYIAENPFKLKERSYPMDFGFPFTNTYLVSIDLGNAYKVEQLPKSRSIKLPNNDGECTVAYTAKDNQINIRFNMKLASYHFQPDAYQSLKKFFGSMVSMLKEEPITLKKL